MELVSVVAVDFKSVFYLKIHQNNIFFIFKKLFFILVLKKQKKYFETKKLNFFIFLESTFEMKKKYSYKALFSEMQYFFSLNFFNQCLFF